MTGNLLKNILDHYNTAAGNSDIGGGTPCICVHGQPHAGKTMILDQVKNALLMNGVNLYFYTDEKDKHSTAEKPTVMHPVSGRHDHALKELLRQLIRMYGSKFDAGIIDFLSMYARGSLAPETSNAIARMHNKDAAARFIYECALLEPVVLLIDDIDMADNYTVSLIGNLFETGVLRFLIISHTDKLDNSVLSGILYRNVKNIKYIQLPDNPFIKPDTASQADSADGAPDQKDAQDNLNIILDEAMLVLTQPGRERQLIRHYMKLAEHISNQLEYERAALILSAALEVCRSLDDSPKNLALEIDLLVRLAGTQFLDKQYCKAAYSYTLAWNATDIQSSALLVEKSALPKPGKEPDAAAPSLDFTDKRINVSMKLAQCYKKLNMEDKAREHIMLTEAYFCTAGQRFKYYGLYSAHIPVYLDFLAETGERVIFREKLKQAYVACRIDDKELTAALYCEEGHMYIENGEFDKAHSLLLDARALAQECSSPSLLDESANALAICSEHMGQPDISDGLWDELIKSSSDLVMVVRAMVNKAIMNYERSGDAGGAVSLIRKALDLCKLASEPGIAAQIRENLKDTPLCV